MSALRSKHVDNLAFALVAPLHSDQNCVCHVKSKMGKKFSRRIRAGHSRDLPTDNKLAASPRNRILGSWPSSMLVGTARCAVRTPQRGVPDPSLQGEGLGASRPDSIIVGRIGPNPFDVRTSRCGGTRRTPLLDWCFSFHGPVSFSNSGIRHRSALDIRLARLRRLRNRSVLRSFRSTCPSRSHFFKRESCRSGFLLARLGFAWRRCRGF